MKQIFGKKPKRGILVMVAILSIAAIIFAAIEATRPLDWTAFPDTALVSNVSDRVHSYAKIIAVDRNHSLLPVTVLAFIGILNDRDVPITIVGYTLEYASVPAGPWTLLCRVELGTDHLIYFVADDITKALPVRVERRLDQIIGRGPLPPRDSISGWSAWYCPATAANCDQEYLRLSIREADGTTKSQIIDNVRTDISPDSLPSLKIVSRAQRNLSSFPKRWPENCPPAF
jgi:hypothetical protein